MQDCNKSKADISIEGTIRYCDHLEPKQVKELLVYFIEPHRLKSELLRALLISIENRLDKEKLREG